MTFQEDKRVDPAALKEAAKAAGFELLATDLMITGRLIRMTGPDNEKALGVKVASTGQVFFLAPGNSEHTRKNYTELEGLLEDGKTRIRIRGRTHEQPGAASELVVTAFEVVARNQNPKGTAPH